MRLYESDEDEAKRGSIPSIEVYVEQLEAQLASAQAVIDAALTNRCPQCGVWVRDMKQSPDAIGSLLAAHLERYPSKGVT